MAPFILANDAPQGIDVVTDRVQTQFRGALFPGVPRPSAVAAVRVSLERLGFHVPANLDVTPLTDVNVRSRTGLVSNGGHTALVRRESVSDTHLPPYASLQPAAGNACLGRLIFPKKICGVPPDQILADLCVYLNACALRTSNNVQVELPLSIYPAWIVCSGSCCTCNLTQQSIIYPLQLWLQKVTDKNNP
eukprot:1190627-Prorocentrum_minimum.AAC.3